MNRTKDRNLIPPGEMILLRFSSENRSNDRVASYAIDGRPNTLWHSKFSGGIVKPPHELVIDLRQEREIQGFRYLARQDGGWNGEFGRTEFSISNSSDKFPAPRVQTVFKKDLTPQSADCAQPIRGRYVKIRITSEVNGKDFASAAEIGVIGK